MEKEKKRFSLTFHTYKLYVLHNKTDMGFNVANLCLILIYFPFKSFIFLFPLLLPRYLKEGCEVDKSALNDNLIKRHRYIVRTK